MTGLWCACGTRIVGRGYVDATNPPADGAGPFLCLRCAADHGRERPGDIAQASAPPIVVDFDQCAREVAAALHARPDTGKDNPR